MEETSHQQQSNRYSTVKHTNMCFCTNKMLSETTWEA